MHLRKSYSCLPECRVLDCVTDDDGVVVSIDKFAIFIIIKSKKLKLLFVKLLFIKCVPHIFRKHLGKEAEEEEETGNCLQLRVILNHIRS